MIERDNNFLQKKKREKEKEKKKEENFKSNILGNIWGQEVLLLLEQGTRSLGRK